MAFPVPLASTLSGATVKQLAYWRARTRSAPPLLVPATKESGRYLYSWLDVVALRTIRRRLPQLRERGGELVELVERNPRAFGRIGALRFDPFGTVVADRAFERHRGPFRDSS
jgi:hypothetical protein